MKPEPNYLAETNRHRASPLSAGEKFQRAVHAQHCVLGGGRSAKRSALEHLQASPVGCMMNVSRITLLGLLLLAASSALASGDDSGWSKPVKGLRARLCVLPPQETNSPFCRVFVELQNVDRALGQKHIRFTRERLALKVHNTNGKELPPANEPYDGVCPTWEPIALPYAGTMRFQISFPGLGYRPAVDKVIVDVGPPKVWIIPQDGSKYFLSGRLSIEAADHPSMDWSGTLELPAVEIPQATTAGPAKS